MSEKELRIRVQGTIQQYINELMSANNISAAMMEDALNKVLSQLKDQVLFELLNSNQQIQEEPQQVETEEEITEDE